MRIDQVSFAILSILQSIRCISIGTQVELDMISSCRLAPCQDGRWRYSLAGCYTGLVSVGHLRTVRNCASWTCLAGSQCPSSAAIAEASVSFDATASAASCVCSRLSSWTMCQTVNFDGQDCLVASLDHQSGVLRQTSRQETPAVHRFEQSLDSTRSRMPWLELLKRCQTTSGKCSVALNFRMATPWSALFAGLSMSVSMVVMVQTAV